MFIVFCFNFFILFGINIKYLEIKVSNIVIIKVG